MLCNISSNKTMGIFNSGSCHVSIQQSRTTASQSSMIREYPAFEFPVQARSKALVSRPPIRCALAADRFQSSNGSPHASSLTNLGWCEKDNHFHHRGPGVPSSRRSSLCALSPGQQETLVVFPEAPFSGNLGLFELYCKGRHSRRNSPVVVDTRPCLPDVEHV